MITNFHQHIPTQIAFGAGMLDTLSSFAMPGKKAMIIISNGKAVINNGALERLKTQLNRTNASYEIFNKIQANPLKSTVMDGAIFAREHECDFIVALGGGSVIDASKAIATLATNEGDCWDYIVGGTGKAKPIKIKPLPIIAITTTAGTGSEVDPWGVITNEETNEKIGFGTSDDLYPVIAIVDPELMVSVPAKYTAFQGFDALFHSTEVYISKFSNSISDMYALTAIENVANSLVKAVNDGTNIEARSGMAFANTLSGMAMTVSCTTSEHSLEHAMSAYHQELPHGAGLIMISIAYYTHFIEKHVCDDRFVRMAKAMGISDARNPMDFITALSNLQRDCGVADLKMSDYGINPSEFEKMAINAKETMGGLFAADREALSVDNCVKIFNQSYK